MSGFRTTTGGRIDRSRRLSFRFDGTSYQGFAGDTLASALMASGVGLLGRSFKYHRPRGVYTMGPEEPSALAVVRTGARREPNVPMTTQELFDGLVAESQNRWPSLKGDIQRFNSYLGRFMTAGFYYKTFMWPKSFWEKVYEPIIRRGAGLGPPPSGRDPDHYEGIHAHCDVLVVGSGAAGLVAARVAAEAGQRVILAEQDFEIGGGLLLEPRHETWRAEMLQAIEAAPEAMVLKRTCVFGCYESNVVGAIERIADHLAEPPPFTARQRYWCIRPKRIVLATGALERLVAFPDNDRPGVMLAGGALAAVQRYGVSPGRMAIVLANNDEAYETAFALSEAGADVECIVDPRGESPIAQEAGRRGIEVRLESEVVGTDGGDGLRAVTVASRGDGRTERLKADLLCISGGHSPAIALASHAQVSSNWVEELQAFVADAGAAHGKGIYPAGAAAGQFGVGAAARSGLEAARRALQSLEAKPGGEFALPDGGSSPRTAVRALWESKGESRHHGKAFVDLQNDTTAEDMRLAFREGYVHIEHAKRYTTHGMATDQGKTGGLVGAAILAEARGEPVSAVGISKPRPFIQPVSFGAISGHEAGKLFEPTRRTSLHAWHERHGAVFMETGLWLRPAYYRIGEEDVWVSIMREVEAVRRRVGLADVSTLGKIDIVGKDAAAFLDRVYTNTFSTLAVGKCRYGLMLREDGMVFDDGTTTRLATDRFLMTTTTANAGPVLEHLEFLLQTQWSDLEVALTSVTDQWAQMSLSGPRARDTLQAALAGLDIANAALPFMGYGEGSVADVPVRVFRISFSGELAYEIATPSGYGERVWQALMDAGARFGIMPYGLEALGAMRIEKGHVAGGELNGQTTARDLGLGKMVKKSGDFVGRAMAEREALTDPERPALVGIRPIDKRERVRAGAHIVRHRAGTDSEGWVTSAHKSLEHDSFVALGMLRRGPKRHGERLFAVYPLRNEAVEVLITSPHHVDPENVRVRA
jgi:sarcosine oxidase subunit alpha